MMFGRYRAHLEADLVKQELLLKFVINDKDKIIARQDEEIKRLRAHNERLVLALTPTPQPAVARRDFKEPPVDGGEGSWNTFLKNYMKEQEDLERKAKEQANVHDQGRNGADQPPSSDAGRPNGGGAAEATGESSAT